MAVETRMAPNRSGSAPPTVEGSIAALRTFMDRKNPNLANSRNEFADYDSEEIMRSDPAYIAYYHANVNLNPRLPPPIISQENSRRMRLMRGVGVKKISAAEGVLATHREEPEEDVSSQQIVVAVTEIASTSGRDRSSFDLMKEDLRQAPPPVSIKALQGENYHAIDTVSAAGSADHIPKSRDQSSDSINAPGNVHCKVNIHLEDNVTTQTNTGSDISVTESGMKSSDITAGLLAEENQRRLEHLHLHDQNIRFPRMIQPFVHPPGFIPRVYATTATHMNSANLVHTGLLPAGFPNPQFSPGGFGTSSGLHPTHPLQMNFFRAPMESLTGEIDPYRSQMIYQTRPFVQNAFVIRPFTGPLQGRFFHPSIQEAQASVHYTDGYPPSLGVPQFPAQFRAAHGTPITAISHPGLGNDLMTSQHPSTIPATLSGWKGQRGSDNSDDCKKNSFLELLKSSSSKKLELSDISGQIVEFSIDQHGSRFIQQKLEYCNPDEKASVFNEVLPYASKLMTDVFGNYVIQKFFEHGTLEHRRQLGEKLNGQVLSLSLQMYGCRVIQKALEVIELDQKVKLVQELDGHVMRCVHDQNGNHVIQKCIEAIPAEKIGFIISSFHGEVSALSSHPYGCRVIQRVLEHCSDEQTSRSIVDEILDSACTLAQDPYGNYVTQHILEMGKPQERSQIIQKLSGKFKEMSQLKFASNVVEKCLKFGDAAERDLIIEEFISESDDNDDLLVLMKDQFANYVVQKIFDLGTEKQKEVFLNCIKSNLPVLKRFTYAKQIVARYEQITEGSAQDQT